VLRHLRARVAALAVLLAGGVCGGEATLSVRAVEPWSGVFGGAEGDVSFIATARRPFEGRVGWAVAYKQRTLVRRELAFAVGPAKEQALRIHVAVPDVRPGVIVPLTLSVAFTDGDGTAASHEKQLWVFPRDPFTDRRQWLKGLGIRLFDPEGRTGKVLEAMKIPFAATANPETLLAVDRGLILIGEGLSFDDYRGVPEIMARAAAKGLPVLCLAPSGGELPVPGAEAAALPAPSRIVLRRRDVIADLDKRLDRDGWPPDGEIVASSVALTADRRIVAARVARGQGGWPWLELHYPAGRGRLLLCGFAIIRKWDTGPAPRFLFARLLERLAGARKAERDGD